MNIIKQLLKDLWILEPQLFKDDRGYFFESFNQREFEEKSVKLLLYKIMNLSQAMALFVVYIFRPPLPKSKLVRVIKGAVLDVAVDIRKGSPTFGKTCICRAYRR